eukprot:gene14369-14903_t
MCPLTRPPHFLVVGGRGAGAQEWEQEKGVTNAEKGAKLGARTRSRAPRADGEP